MTKDDDWRAEVSSNVTEVSGPMKGSNEGRGEVRRFGPKLSRPNEVGPSGHKDLPGKEIKIEELEWGSRLKHKDDYKVEAQSDDETNSLAFVPFVKKEVNEVIDSIKRLDLKKEAQAEICPSVIKRRKISEEAMSHIAVILVYAESLRKVKARMRKGIRKRIG